MFRFFSQSIVFYGQSSNCNQGDFAVLPRCFVIVKSAVHKMDFIIDSLLQGDKDATYSTQINKKYLSIYESLEEIDDIDFYYATSHRSLGEVYILEFQCSKSDLEQLARQNQFSIGIRCYFDAVAFRNEKLLSTDVKENILQIAKKITIENHSFDNDRLLTQLLSNKKCLEDTFSVKSAYISV